MLRTIFFFYYFVILNLFHIHVDRESWYIILVFNKICVRSLEMIPLAVSAQVPRELFFVFRK